MSAEITGMTSASQEAGWPRILDQKKGKPKKGCRDFQGHLGDIPMTLAHEQGGNSCYGLNVPLKTPES